MSRRCRAGMSVVRRVRVLVLLLLAAGTSAAAAQTDVGAGELAGLPDRGPLTVHLVTIGPGDAVWERFGHNALWVHDERTGQDIWWNWGLFSFSQEGFLTRFVKGEMLYSMGGREMAAELAQYRSQGRDVWAQELALTQAQADDLDRFVRWNAQPANRDYIYDYFDDNCSTRVRDALDRVLGGALRAFYFDMPAGTTWRREARRHVEVSPLTDAGVVLGLGQPADRAMTAWDAMFLPLELRRRVGGLFLEQRDGTMRPLVVREVKLVDAGRALPAEAPMPLWPRWLMAGLGIGLVIVAVGAVTNGRRTPGRLAMAIPVAAWSLVAGLGGLVLAGFYLTDHDFAVLNENLLLASPLSLAVGLFALVAPLRPAALGSAARLARWVAACALLGLALKAVPGWFVQGNAEVLALTLPVHLATAWALTRAHRTTDGPKGAPAR